MDENEGNASRLWTTPLNDIEELQDEAQAVGWDIRYTQNEPGPLNGTLQELSLPGLMVAHEIYGRSFFFCASLPKDFAPALFPLRAREGVRLNGQLLGADDIAMPKDLSELACGGPYGIDLITLHVEPESMRDLSALVGQDQFDDLLRWSMVHHQGDHRQREAFQALLASLLQDEMWPATATANRTDAIRNRILEDFAGLLADAGPVGSPSRNVHRSVWVQYAREARAFMDANLDRAISLADLCRVTNTSARTLQYAFRDLYGAAPLAYHRVQRLYAVRQALRRRWPGEASVTDVALGHGFWHLGRFSQAYKTWFGESPSETLAKRPAQLMPMSPFSYNVKLSSFRRSNGAPVSSAGTVIPFKQRAADQFRLPEAAPSRPAQLQAGSDD